MNMKHVSTQCTTVDTQSGAAAATYHTPTHRRRPSAGALRDALARVGVGHGAIHREITPSLGHGSRHGVANGSAYGWAQRGDMLLEGRRVATGALHGAVHRCIHLKRHSASASNAGGQYAHKPHGVVAYLRGSRPHIQVPILERWQHHLHDFVHVEARSSARRHTVDLEAKLIDEGFQQAQS